MSLVHLATVPSFSTVISRNFVLLAITIQDPCYQVRMAFVNKLITRLRALKLPAAYNVIPFLSIHDPEADVITLNKAYVLHSFKTMPKRKSPFAISRLLVDNEPHRASAATFRDDLCSLTTLVGTSPRLCIERREPP